MGVNWYVAKRICELQGKRLPTEAEWEYAARGGKQNKYGTSDGNLTNENACWSGENNSADKGATCAVGSYDPNPFGLYDISGNVWEWIEDDWHSNYDSAPVDGTAWIDDPRGPYRVILGGSWRNYYPDPVFLRAAFRDIGCPDNPYVDVGFRCVSSEDSQK